MSTSSAGNRRTWWFIALGALAALAVAVIATQTCIRTGLTMGLWLNQCPDGDLRQTVSVVAPSLSRRGPSTVLVSAQANFTTTADQRHTASLSSFSATLALITPQGSQALTPVDGWKSVAAGREARVQLPPVNDGDYLLRATVTSSLGTTQLDLPLPLFAPARVHVLTDRPLYEPGNTVKFRAVALRATDLTPLDGRPGIWRVADPTGEVLLEERSPAGPWGVSSGTFPLDALAPSGTWTVTWSSGDAAVSKPFEVRPFTLPRFRVEAAPGKPYYRRLERPTLRGTVRYSSGAPVAHAKLEVTWSVRGEWPPPTSWIDGEAMPTQATAGPNGSFVIELPQVPEDLVKQATVVAHLAAIDASGDRVQGQAEVLLSEDHIAVAAVSELPDGLVAGFNNRVYLRAATADGKVLERATLKVRRLWEPTDRGTEVVADEDGVAHLQIDPGPPVNVVQPAPPFRPPPRVQQVARANLDDALAPEGEVDLPDRLTFDRLERNLERCTQYRTEGDVLVGVLVRTSGAIAHVSGPNTALGRCVIQVIREARFQPSRERLFSASFAFNDSDLPRLAADPIGVPEVPEEVNEALNEALVGARDCLPPTTPSAQLPKLMTWTYDPKKAEVPLSWVNGPSSDSFPPALQNCLERRLTRLTLRRRAAATDPDLDGDEGAPSSTAVGIVRLTVTAPERYEAERPQPTVLVGYEFLVTAKKGGETLGSTKLLLRPGAVPPVRLRANAQILRPGATVSVELLRGPDFVGELPEALFLTQGRRQLRAKVDPASRTAAFELPDDLEGWASVEWYGAKVVLFVQPKAQLSVTVTPERPRYAPGQLAHLELETRLNAAPGPAAVGLFGVDESLAQLTPLPGADELAPLRPQVTSAAPFPGLDAQALSLGRIRGAHAAAATLLRVSALPTPAELDTAVALNGQTTFDPNETLVDRFYAALAELHQQTRAWESSAPPSEKMSPKTMARLWTKALDALEGRKEGVRDSFGRRLRLHRLPTDLLALTEPRLVVIDGTRLPEDTENWSAWVAKERP